MRYLNKNLINKLNLKNHGSDKSQNPIFVVYEHPENISAKRNGRKVV